MKKYERPIVMINEELAEGVYAASGGEMSRVGDCWEILEITPVKNGNTMSTEEYVQVNIQLLHINSDNHLSSAKLVIDFNQTITGYDANRTSNVPLDYSGTTVTLYPNVNTSNSNEKKGYNITVKCDNPSGLECTSAYIECTGL